MLPNQRRSMIHMQYNVQCKYKTISFEKKIYLIFCDFGLGKDFSENTNHKKKDKFDSKTLKTSVHQNTPLKKIHRKTPDQENK